MRLTALFSHTLREAPSDAVLPSHRLLTRAGYVQEIGKGSYAVLPLGRAARKQINQTLLKALPAQTARVDLPVLSVYDGHLHQDANSIHFKDPQNRNLHLLSQAETSFDELVKQHLSSYRHLPAVLQYQGPVWTEEVHPSSGLLYSRMPQMLALFGSFANRDSLQEWTTLMKDAADNAFTQLGIAAMSAEDSTSEEDLFAPIAWYFPHPAGKTQVFTCEHCRYTARDVNARFTRQAGPDEPRQPLQKVATPDCKTIEALADFLDIPKNRTAKAIFLVAELEDAKEELIFAIIPGDRDLNEKQLARAIKARHLRPAEEAEIMASGAVPGYGSPVGLENIFVIVDAQIPHSANLVAGANESGFHLVNVNYERDYKADLIAEITLPKTGDSCPSCQNALQVIDAVEIAQLRQAKPDHSFMGPDGKIIPLHALSFHWFTDRLLACTAETYNNQYGLVLPPACAPYPIHLVLIPDKEGIAAEQADLLHDKLIEAGLEPLFDDRRDRAGVKFMDADLIGLPLRLTVSKRSLSQGGVECKLRTDSEAQLVPHEKLFAFIQSALNIKNLAVSSADQIK